MRHFTSVDPEARAEPKVADGVYPPHLLVGFRGTGGGREEQQCRVAVPQVEHIAAAQALGRYPSSSSRRCRGRVAVPQVGADRRRAGAREVPEQHEKLQKHQPQRSGRDQQLVRGRSREPA